MTEVKSRREEYTTATRRALLDAAAELFVERGFAGTSLDDIAAAARVSKGAIYHHFARKSGVLEALLEELETVETERARAAFAAAADPVDGAVAAVDRFLDACTQPIYGAIVFRECPVALGWDRWREYEAKYSYALLDRVLGALAEAGAIPAQRGEALPSILFGMLAASGQLLVRTPVEHREQVRAECRTPFVALLAGLSVETRRGTHDGATRSSVQPAPSPRTR